MVYRRACEQIKYYSWEVRPRGNWFTKSYQYAKRNGYFGLDKSVEPKLLPSGWGKKSAVLDEAFLVTTISNETTYQCGIKEDLSDSLLPQTQPKYFYGMQILNPYYRYRNDNIVAYEISNLVCTNRKDIVLPTFA
ncbi:hypothetical protein CEXT_311791 [Caerostris extrusa]|uniref:Uncharacterized protein n=1 Tax=Caerostris extrusa TaxID=172846 RepID=A0AAV4YDE2_CAEEX|nr:hypothetical protein CEXT_311791 [Caerostris extrusa]